MKEFNALAERNRINHDWLNYRSAQICAVLANMFRGKNAKVFTPADFMPNRKTHREQTSEQMAKIARMLNTAFGGTNVEK